MSLVCFDWNVDLFWEAKQVAADFNPRLAGHRTGVRWLAVAMDDSMFLGTKETQRREKKHVKGLHSREWTYPLDKYW